MDELIESLARNRERQMLRRHVNALLVATGGLGVLAAALVWKGDVHGWEWAMAVPLGFFFGAAMVGLPAMVAADLLAHMGSRHGFRLLRRRGSVRGSV